MKLFNRLKHLGRAEHRASNYTDSVIEALIGSATQGRNDSLTTGAAVTGIRAISDAFALAVATSLTPQGQGIAAMLSGPLLADYARRMLTGGNFVATLETDNDGRISLVPVSSFDVGGRGITPATWAYELTYATPASPDGTKRRRPGGAVIHCRLNASADKPWQGRGPLSGLLTADALANAEASLRDDYAARTGYLIPMPDGVSQANVDKAAAVIRDGKGGTQLVEGTSGGMGLGPTAAPRGNDWRSERFGPNPPQPNYLFRDSASAAVLAALGVSDKMWGGSGQDMREAYRLLIAGPVQALAVALEQELLTKLGAAIKFNFADADSTDARGLGRAVGSLVQAGLPLANALEIVGIGTSRLYASTLPPTPQGDDDDSRFQGKIFDVNLNEWVADRTAANAGNHNGNHNGNSDGTEYR